MYCSNAEPYIHSTTVLCDVLSGLSVKQEVKGLMTNYITMNYPGRKLVYLQIVKCIGVAVSEFRFFMTLRVM